MPHIVLNGKIGMDNVNYWKYKFNRIFRKIKKLGDLNYG